MMNAGDYIQSSTGRMLRITEDIFEWHWIDDGNCIRHFNQVETISIHTDIDSLLEVSSYYVFPYVNRFESHHPLPHLDIQKMLSL